MTQQEFWNKKFLRDGYLYGKEPNAFISSFYSNFKKSQRVLCLGEGEGRNAVFLAKKGYEVTAIDASDIAMEKLQKFAQEQNVSVHTKCMDLNSWEPSEKYGAIVFSYLHLLQEEQGVLFEKIASSLNPGGFFVAEVFSKNQLNYSSGGPKDEALLYSTLDFENSLKGLNIQKLEETTTELSEGNGHIGEASVIRIIAQKN